MVYGIWGLLVVLALVLVLGLPSLAQDKTTKSPRGSRPGVAQTAMLATAPKADSPFKILVIHPADRTDFATIEQSVSSVSGMRNVVTQYHSMGDPATSTLLNKLRIRMALGQTMIVIQAPNGAVTWGGAENAMATLDPNVAFPSATMTQIIKSAQEGKDVLMVFSNDQKPNGQQLVRAANAYAQTPTNKAETFVIDPNDPQNADIVSRTKLPADSLKDARLLLLVGGKVQGQLSGFVSDTSIAALKKSCSGKSGCC